MSFTIRAMQMSDVMAVARLHQVAFPESFLTHLGQSLLAKYYAQFLRNQQSWAVVALTMPSAAPVGFCVGSSDSGALVEGFYREHFSSIGLTLAFKASLSKALRQQTWLRIAQLPRALRARLRPEGLIVQTPDAAQPARLVALAVAPPFRGTGVAAALVDAWGEALFADGIADMNLSVAPTNWRALAFYKKTGWQTVKKIEGRPLTLRRRTRADAERARA